MTTGYQSTDLLRKALSAFTTQERTCVETLWAELAEFILQSQNGQFLGDQSRGIKKDQNVFDSTAVIACRDLASAMHSTITNPAMKWSKLRFKEQELNNDYDSTNWLDQATDIMHGVFSESNLDSQLGSNYSSVCGLATGVLFHEEVEDAPDIFNFINWHLSEVAYSENRFGIVDCIYRKFTMTYQQLVEQFPDSVPQFVLDKVDTEPMEEETIYLCIYPRKKKDVKLNEVGLAPPEKRPFASCYIMEREAYVLGEDGYYEFPVYVCRWSKLPGEIYGFGPGHAARPDVRTLCKVREDKLKALAKATNPVIITTQNNVLTTDFRPGKLVTVRDTDKIKEFVTQTRFDVLQVEEQELRASIKSAFYIDKLLLPPRTETGEMTAYEISQRLEQMQTILGPALNRLNMELLQPLVLRSLKILMRRNMIPPIPQKTLQLVQSMGKDPRAIDLEITFVNSLSRSQQLGELRNVQSFVQEVFQMAQANPQVLDKLNLDAIIDYDARIRSIPESLIETDEQVQAIRQQRQQAQAQQQQLAAGQQIGDIVKNVGSVMPKSGGQPQ